MKKLIMAMVILIGFGANAQTLDDYFKMAIENNPGLQAQHKEFEASMQKVAQISGLPDPSLTMSAFGQMVETRVGPQRARFSLVQMFPWFGTLKAQGDVVALMAEAKYQSYIDARNKLYYDVAAAYFPLVELRESIKIEEKSLELFESYKTLANSKFASGSGSLVDVLRVDLLVKESMAALAILRKKDIPLLTSFNKLLNREASETVSIPDAPWQPSLEKEYRKDSLLVNHPILNAVNLKIEASEASERAAVKQGLPKLGVGIDYIAVGERTDLAAGAMAPPDNGKDVLMPMVTFSLPIFRGKYKAAIKEAQLMQESYTLQKAETANALQTQYETALYELGEQAELMALFDQQIQESGQILNLLYKAYGNSGKELEEVLRMQQQLFNYEKQKVKAMARYRVSLAKLDYITAK